MDVDYERMYDDHIAVILQSAAADIQEGERNREEILTELISIITRNSDDPLIRVGEIGDRGRVSFGRSHEGDQGVSIFLPEDLSFDEIERDWVEEVSDG